MMIDVRRCLTVSTQVTRYTAAPAKPLIARPAASRPDVNGCRVFTAPNPRACLLESNATRQRHFCLHGFHIFIKFMIRQVYLSFDTLRQSLKSEGVSLRGVVVFEELSFL